MRNVTRDYRTVLRGLAGAAFGALVLVGTPGQVRGQDARPAASGDESPVRQAAPPFVRLEGPPGFEAMSDRPRLGVYLRADCEVGAAAGGTCPTPPVVASVVEGAPAAAAGLVPGDTLLAIDGVDLRTEAARRAMGTLEEGVPVSLRVGRDSGRSTIRVTPTARPSTGLFRLSGTPWSTVPRSDLQVFRARDADGRVAEVYFAPPSGRASTDGFVVFGQGEDGTFKLEFGRPGVEVVTPDGRLLELAELEKHLRGLEHAEPGQAPRVLEGVQAYRLEMELESDGLKEAVRHRVILENEQLAERLKTVHSSVLSDARVRLDSVRKLQVELARRGELPPAAAAGYSYVVPSGRSRVRAPEPARWTEAVVAPADHRLAGAEFRALTPELAEYFPVDEGLLVLRVIPETPAHRLGLRGGDVVVEVGGRSSPDMITFRRLLAESQAASNGLVVKWNRKGREMSGSLASR